MYALISINFIVTTNNNHHHGSRISFLMQFLAFVCRNNDVTHTHTHINPIGILHGILQIMREHSTILQNCLVKWDSNCNYFSNSIYFLIPQFIPKFPLFFSQLLSILLRSLCPSPVELLCELFLLRLFLPELVEDDVKYFLIRISQSRKHRTHKRRQQLPQFNCNFICARECVCMCVYFGRCL